DLINRAVTVEALDSLYAAKSKFQVFYRDGKAFMSPFPLYLGNLSLFYEPDSLDATFEQNTGTMVFNRGVALFNASPPLVPQACGFFADARRTIEIPPEYRAYVNGYCDGDQAPEQAQPVQEGLPIGTVADDVEQQEAVAVPPESAEDPKALLFRRGERLVDALAELKANILRRFPDRGSRIDNLIRRIDQWSYDLDLKIRKESLTEGDLSTVDRLLTEGNRLMNGEHLEEDGEGVDPTLPQSTSPAPAAAVPLSSSNVPKILRVTLVRLVCEKSDEGLGSGAEIDRFDFQLRAQESKCEAGNRRPQQATLYRYNGDPVEVSVGQVWRDTNQSVELTLNPGTCGKLDLSILVYAREHDLVTGGGPDEVRATYRIPFSGKPEDFSWLLKDEQFVFRCEFRVEKVGEW
ncbi:MAG: hypothetical protein AAF597_10555, partial [Bacteroidota bacterium]